MLDDVEHNLVEQSLGIAVAPDCMNIDTGPHWIIANVETAADLAAIAVDNNSLSDLLNKYSATGITVYTADKNKASVRTLFSANNLISEDPVCGSGNAAVAVHIKHTGRLSTIGPQYQAQQGQFVGSDGIISVQIGDNITVGGCCNTVFSGEAAV